MILNNDPSSIKYCQNQYLEKVCFLVENSAHLSFKDNIISSSKSAFPKLMILKLKILILLKSLIKSHIQMKMVMKHDALEI